MRILFLTAGFPYPPISGGLIKTLSILDYLRARHQLTVVCFNRQPLTTEQVRWAEDFGAIQSVLVKKGRDTRNLVSSYLHRLPWGIERSRSAEMRRAVSAAADAGEFDAVFVDHWLVAQYLPDGFAGRKLFHEHNAEYVIWRRYAELERNPLRRALARLEAWRVRRYEAAILTHFDTVFAVSEADRQALVEIGADPARVHVLPNVPDPKLLTLPRLSFAETQPIILYFGTLSWQPNLEGLAYFLRSVFPRVRVRLPETRFVIAGTGAPDWLQRLASSSEGVEFLGPIDDPDPLYRRARLLVEATRSGGGTKLKVLNSLARGLPVFASLEAIEGIETIPGEHLLAESGAEAMAEAVVHLQTDADLWQRLSEAGRALIRERYVAEVAFAPLDQVLSDARATA